MRPAKRRPLHSVRVLHKWVDDHVKDTGGTVVRTQRWISFMVIATILDGVRDENDDPVFVLKGGAAMELRLGLDARATKDYDVTFRDRTADMLARLDEALQRPHADFAITRTEPVQDGETHAQRLDLKLAYRGRSWQTVQFEIAPAEGEAGQEIDRIPAIPLDHLGLEGLDRVPCVSVRYQMAQKLHACTERENDRSRDLIDEPGHRPAEGVTINRARNALPPRQRARHAQHLAQVPQSLRVPPAAAQRRGCHRVARGQRAPPHV